MKKEMKKGKGIVKGFFVTIGSLLLLVTAVVTLINVSMILLTRNRILTEEEAVKKGDFDCILVLGAGVKSDKTPSHMLEDRLLEGIELYQMSVSECLLMSGDHGTKYYDEVNCMKNYAMEHGVPSNAIYMDHAGFCTYDSVYRAKYIFGAKKILIITQDYHMYRALYDAKNLGLDAYGVISNPREYQGQLKREGREILARVKDFMVCIRKPEASVMGSQIPLTGDGDVTNDK